MSAGNSLAGITRNSCPTGCSIDHCLLAAGRPFCFHPCGSGVPFNLKNDPAIQKLYADACAALGVKNRNEVAAA
jgi:hypothetical protein